MFVDRFKVPQEIIDQIRTHGYVSPADVSASLIKESSDGKHLANDRVDSYFNLAYRDFLRNLLEVSTSDLKDQGLALSTPTKHVNYLGSIRTPKRFPIFTGVTGISRFGFEIVQVWDNQAGVTTEKPLAVLGMVLVLNENGQKQSLPDKMRFNLNRALLQVSR